jgi:hypothetical protein
MRLLHEAGTGAISVRQWLVAQMPGVAVHAGSMDIGTRQLRPAFLGDSFANGTGDLSCLGWSGRAYATLWAPSQLITCYNLGVRGDTTADVFDRRRAAVERRYLVSMTESWASPSASPGAAAVLSLGSVNRSRCGLDGLGR